MSTIQIALYVAAALVLLIGAALDDPRFNVMRCTAVAGALLVLAHLPVPG